MAKVTYVGINTQVQSEDQEATLLDISNANKIPHTRECGGNGKCTTCRVRVLKGAEHLTPPTAWEEHMAAKRSWDPSIRLACQCKPTGDIEIQRLIWTSSAINRLQLETLRQGLAEEKPIALLVCDLRNFTQITASNLSFDMAHMLNRFYNVLGDPILKNNGIIYQYVGDEIIGIFGIDSGNQTEVCQNAIRAALGMQYAIDRLNHLELKDLDTHFKIGIGVHHGTAYMGYLGHPNHRQLAIVGDPINVASRIQGMTKDTQTGLLISEPVLQSLPPNSLEIEAKHVKHLKGKPDPFTLYEVKGFQELDLNLELQASLDDLMKSEQQFAQLFYDRLFEKAPELRDLFKVDIEAQGKLLTHMVVGIIYALSRPKNLVMGLTKLGGSHVHYGVKPSHYPVVLEVMMETLKDLFQSRWTARRALAWEKALTFITDQMQEGARKVTDGCPYQMGRVEVE